MREAGLGTSDVRVATGNEVSMSAGPKKTHTLNALAIVGRFAFSIVQNPTKICLRPHGLISRNEYPTLLQCKQFRSVGTCRHHLVVMISH